MGAPHTECEHSSASLSFLIVAPFCVFLQRTPFPERSGLAIAWVQLVLATLQSLGAKQLLLLSKWVAVAKRVSVCSLTHSVSSYWVPLTRLVAHKALGTHQ